MTSIAAQLYSLRDLVSTDRERALRELGSIGYRAVEAYDPLADPAGFRAAADAAGLAVCSTHGGGPRRDELPAALRTLGTAGSGIGCSSCTSRTARRPPTTR